MVETETATFWYDSPEVQRGELRPRTSRPKCSFSRPPATPRRTGTFTNTQRLLQWREKAVDPPGDCAQRGVVHPSARPAAQGEGATRSRVRATTALRALTLGLPRRRAHGEPDAEDVLREINGVPRRRSHAACHGFADARRADGIDGLRLLDLLRRLSGRRREPRARARRAAARTATAGASPGRPIAASSTTAPPRAPTARRGASARSWSGGTRTTREWTGLDVAGLHAQQGARLHPAADARGDDALAGDAPFIMHADGLGWLWVPIGLKDGPLPTHYEPLESPVAQSALRRSRSNPGGDSNASVPTIPTRSPRSALPVRAHDLSADRASHRRRHDAHALASRRAAAGAVLRDLARAGGAKSASRNGDWVAIVDRPRRDRARARWSPRACVRSRSTAASSTRSACRSTGARGLVTGDVANDLIAISEEPNVADHGVEGAARVTSVRAS